MPRDILSHFTGHGWQHRGSSSLLGWGWSLSVVVAVCKTSFLGTSYHHMLYQLCLFLSCVPLRFLSLSFPFPIPWRRSRRDVRLSGAVPRARIIHPPRFLTRCHLTATRETERPVRRHDNISLVILAISKHGNLALVLKPDGQGVHHWKS